MHIAAIHDIADPQRFWSTVQQAEIPAGITLHASLPNADGTRAVCHWEAASVDAVRGLVEDTVGHYATHEFYEINSQTAIGL